MVSILDNLERDTRNTFSSPAAMQSMAIYVKAALVSNGADRNELGAPLAQPIPLATGATKEEKLEWQKKETEREEFETALTCYRKQKEAFGLTPKTEKQFLGNLLNLYNSGLQQGEKNDKKNGTDFFTEDKKPKFKQIYLKDVNTSKDQNDGITLNLLGEPETEEEKQLREKRQKEYDKDKHDYLMLRSEEGHPYIGRVAKRGLEDRARWAFSPLTDQNLTADEKIGAVLGSLTGGLFRMTVRGATSVTANVLDKGSEGGALQKGADWLRSKQFGSFYDNQIPKESAALIEMKMAIHKSTLARAAADAARQQEHAQMQEEIAKMRQMQTMQAQGSQTGVI